MTKSVVRQARVAMGERGQRLAREIIERDSMTWREQASKSSPVESSGQDGELAYGTEWPIRRAHPCR